MGIHLGPYYPTLAASDRLRILVEELRWSGPTLEILRELGAWRLIFRNGLRCFWIIHPVRKLYIW